MHRSPTSSTSRIQRRPLVPDEEVDLRFHPRSLAPAAPCLPAKPPGPFGDLSEASIEQITDASRLTWPTLGRAEPRFWTRGLGEVLAFLQRFDGTTWQARWEAAGLEEADKPLSSMIEDNTWCLTRASYGLRLLWCMRVVRPGFEAFRANQPRGYAELLRSIQRDPLMEELCALVDASGEKVNAKRATKYEAAGAMTVLGIPLADLTPEGLLYYGEHRMRCVIGTESGKLIGHHTWNVLHRMGHFPASAPEMMRAALLAGQRSVPEMIDRFPIRNREIRDLLIDYVARRALDLDYTSADRLAHNLARLFWLEVEKVNPDQADLRLSQETYLQWKERAQKLPDGRERMRLDVAMVSVRAFYLDLQSWAVAEPERWARWAAPCPIRDSELVRSNVRIRAVNERMAERTRQRQPLLPLLVDHLDQQLESLQGLLTATEAVAPGEEFLHQGRRYRRTNTKADRYRARSEGTPPPRITDLETGRTVNAADQEDDAFWTWACVEILRHSGLRVEELTELTHLSIRQYQRPNGEVVALLVIAPSKTDRERIIPMSAELFAAIAAIVRRHLRTNPTIPVIRRYDHHERLWSQPLPYLIQRKHSSGRAVISMASVAGLLRKACGALAPTHPEFANLTFAPHDFRRLFATDLVNNGLPIHIGAALLGHLSIQTTRGYIAVFEEDLVRHYQAFLDKRRALRPAEEYTPPTDEEWTEFEEHFDKRRVELGNCGRPYGTPCAHEHACIRCPVLQVSPKMLPRLDDIEDDLQQRRERAMTEGWLGEVEGIDLTLSFLRSKRDHTQRFSRRIPLGLPQIRQAST